MIEIDIPTIETILDPAKFIADFEQKYECILQIDVEDKKLKAIRCYKGGRMIFAGKRHEGNGRFVFNKYCKKEAKANILEAAPQLFASKIVGDIHEI